MQVPENWNPMFSISEEYSVQIFSMGPRELYDCIESDQSFIVIAAQIICDLLWFWYDYKESLIQEDTANKHDIEPSEERRLYFVLIQKHFQYVQNRAPELVFDQINQLPSAVFMAWLISRKHQGDQKQALFDYISRQFGMPDTCIS